VKPTRQQRLQLLAQQREQLQQQAQLQRFQLATHWHALRVPARWLAWSWQIVTALRQRPWMLLLPSVAIAVARPRRAWARVLTLLPWVWRGVQVWQQLSGRPQRAKP
jgi:hypothetical protein